MESVIRKVKSWGNKNPKLRRGLKRKSRLIEALEIRHLLACDLGAATGLVADFDCNGALDFNDFLVLSESFGDVVETPGTGADLNNDGSVGFPDFLILSDNFGSHGGQSSDGLAGETSTDELLSHHDGYWVGEVSIPGVPINATVISDTYFDAETNRITVYAQNRVLNRVVAPPQVGPGECARLPNGTNGCFHPNAVYLNGSGVELMEADGTGEWWVKHSWIVGGEGYENVQLGATEEYDGIYVEGELQEDGSVRVGGLDPLEEGYFFNVRAPQMEDIDPPKLTVTRFLPANTDPAAGEIDLTPVQQPNPLTLACTDGFSALDGSARGCPKSLEEPAVSEDVLVAFEVLQVVSPNEIIVWANMDGITQEEFEAIELPRGWFKNQPREIVMDSGQFASSPGAAPGEFVEEELFGSAWRHVASIVEANVPLDDAQLLTVNTISKSHELTFNAGTTLSILTSPENEHYVLTTRDVARTSDMPTIPNGWRLSEHTLDEDLIVQLPNPTLNIRADNEDSFQGPVPKLAAFADQSADEHSDEEDRYCELLAVTAAGGTASAEVWLTSNPDDCTANVWNVDLEQASEDLDAIQVIKNGPRYFVIDDNERLAAGSVPPIQEVAGMQMVRVASVESNQVQTANRTPYQPNLVDRNNVFTFDAGYEVYELTNPDGDVYIMQSYAQIVDSTLTRAELPGLGSRLELPVGWTYTSRVLDEPIVLTASEPIEVLQDELQNSYSKLRDGESPMDPDDETGEHSTDCFDDPVLLTAADGTGFVRTPDSCFADLPDWPYEPRYVEIDGLRQGYVDEGPEDGPVVLLLHGQPSWSYLYRDMIPVLADAGYRVIAMDHLGMGRSDKPIDIDRYSFLDHNYRLEQFIAQLELTDVNLFAQDWGSLIGLRTAGLNTDLFASISIGNGSLPILPAGQNVQPPVENPDEIVDIPSLYAQIPDQQVPFYDGCEPLPLGGGQGQGDGDPGGELGQDFNAFGYWMRYAMTGASFLPSGTVESLTWFDLSPEEEAAYDAPFPSRTYMAGPRVFPSLINDVPGTTEEAWVGLGSFEKPFLTIWASNDPGTLGSCEAQQFLIDSVPGAEGQPHTRLAEASHFLQDDQGEEIATRLVSFYEANGIVGVNPTNDIEPEILSAYLGLIDAPHLNGADGMPLVFSVQIDPNTLSHDDFVVTTASGKTMTPVVATLQPAAEADESRTVLLAGPLGSADDIPVSVEVVGSVRSVNGEELQGLTAEVTTNEFGTSLVLALVDPADTNAAGNETTPTRIQLTFSGGVSGDSGSELGLAELFAFRIIDENGSSHIPTGFEDLADNDNHVVLLVPPGVEPASVVVQSNSLYDPTNQPNASSSVEVLSTIELL